MLGDLVGIDMPHVHGIAEIPCGTGHQVLCRGFPSPRRGATHQLLAELKL